MTRALSIAVAATILSAHAQEPLREVFPVPPIVDSLFRSAGLVAFDPFESWQKRKPLPVLLPPSSPGDDGPRLPPGVCHDILPALTARGFTPHAGTRVLYHPQTQLIFARVAPADEAQVRAFCEWPPAVWLNEFYLRDSGTVQQILLRVATYEVLATGPGGWDFRPSSSTELLALPAEARRVTQRGSTIIRGGQRSRIEGCTTPPLLKHVPLQGLSLEAECTVGDDLSTIDLYVGPHIYVRLDDGSRLAVQPLFQQLIEWGGSWLMETATLPGNPPRRIFQIWEVLRVHADMRQEKTFHQFYERWTGKPAIAARIPDSSRGRAFQSNDFPWDRPLPSEVEAEKSLLPAASLLPPYVPEKPNAPADPFASPPEMRTPLDGEPVVTVPELFGNAQVHDLTKMLEAVTGIPPGLVRAWRPVSGQTLYVQGQPEGMAALTLWQDRNATPHIPPPSPSEAARIRSWGESIPEYTSHTAIVEAEVRAAGKTVWRNTIPIRMGQRSGVRISPSPATDDDTDNTTPVLCFFEIEASSVELPGPGEVYNWTLEAAITLATASPSPAPLAALPPVKSWYSSSTCAKCIYPACGGPHGFPAPPPKTGGFAASSPKQRSSQPLLAPWETLLSLRSMNPHEDPAALKALQDSIYRERVLRARNMTPDERLAAVFELTNSVFERMHEGAMWQLGTSDAEKGWEEVERRLDRLRRVEERGRYVTLRPPDL